MKKTTKSLVRLIISIVYIIWGIASPLTLIKSVLALNVSAILGAAVGIITLLAGVFGLLGIKKDKCRIFGVIIFVLAIVSFATALPSISFNSIVNGVLAWLFITCL